MRISRTKVFGILLALCMVFTMMPAAAFAEENQIDIYTADDLANKNGCFMPVHITLARHNLQYTLI